MAISKKNKEITSPHTNEELDNDFLMPQKNLRPKIAQFLEKHPAYWSEVYMSKKIQTDFLNALAKKDKKALAELVKQEPASFKSR